jgi:hypothetical protein
MFCSMILEVTFEILSRLICGLNVWHLQYDEHYKMCRALLRGIGSENFAFNLHDLHLYSKEESWPMVVVRKGSELLRQLRETL